MEEMLFTEQDLEEIKQFREDRIWLEEQKDELKKKYKNQWVAILNKKVVGTSPDYSSLIESLKRKNIELGKVVVEYLSTTEEIFIFADMIKCFIINN